MEKLVNHVKDINTFGKVFMMKQYTTPPPSLCKRIIPHLDLVSILCSDGGVGTALALYIGNKWSDLDQAMNNPSQSIRCFRFPKERDNLIDGGEQISTAFCETKIKLRSASC